jgi:signal transduction histidine kinase
VEIENFGTFEFLSQKRVPSSHLAFPPNFLAWKRVSGLIRQKESGTSGRRCTQPLFISEEAKRPLSPSTSPLHSIASFNHPLMNPSRTPSASESARLLSRWQTVQTIAESLDSLDLDQTLLTIRNALVEQAGFDRAGILLVDPNDPAYLLGTWGTAPDGGPQSEHHDRSRVADHPNTSRILRGEVPFVLRHTTLDNIPEPLGTSPETLQHAIVPFKQGDRYLGVISVDNLFTQRPIDEEDVQFLQLIAQHVALAVHKAQSHAQEQRRAQDAARIALRLERLQEAAVEVASSLSSADALQRILASAKQVLEADRWAVWQPEGEQGWRCIASEGLSETYKEASARQIAATPTQMDYARSTLRGGDAVVVEDVATDPKWAQRRALALSEGIRSLVVFSLRVGGEWMGTLVFYHNAPHRYSNEDLTLGQLFAHHAAMALYKAQLFDRMQRAQEDLEDRVKERTRQLEEAQERLVRQERLAAIGQVSATIAHELRNPLGVIHNSAFLLQRHLAGAEVKVVQTLEMLNRQIKTCEGIINELLDFTRDIHPNVQPTSWKEVVQSALDSLPCPPDTIQVNLGSDFPGFSADPQWMSRVVANLIQNAAQSCSGERDPIIRVEAGADETGAWLSVTDDGPGVPPHLSERIFEPFFTTRAKGTGLGLSLVKRAVEAHGGQIVLETGEGAGARFLIRLTFPV